MIPAPSEIFLRAAPTPSGDTKAGGSGGHVLIHGFLTVPGRSRSAHRIKCC